MTPNSLILHKLSIILSSTLAHNNSGRWLVMDAGNNNNNNTSSNTTNFTTATCTDPCAELNKAIQSEILALVPYAIAVAFSLIAVLPTLVLKGKHKILGIKSYLWVLFQLWVHLLLTHLIFTRDKAQAYVWALHSTSHVLSVWRPKRGILRCQMLHFACTNLGAMCVALFAWQLGPSVGLAAWYSKGDALCGWSVHLIAVLGVELAQWVLGPVELLIGRL